LDDPWCIEAAPFSGGRKEVPPTRRVNFEREDLLEFCGSAGRGGQRFGDPLGIAATGFGVA
jgi:hypothetical protein